MARSVDAPSCVATHQQRGALWRQMLRINRVHRRPRGQGPITAAMQVVYDYLLWKAPRGLGVLIPAKRTIATATGVGLATVKRAIAALVEWGLLLVERRWLRGKKPVRVGDEVRVINARMDTSNAYSFPPADEALVGGAQTDLVANALSTREAKNKALEKLRDRWGRWIPAASAAMVERLMAKWGIEESYEL